MIIKRVEDLKIVILIKIADVKAVVVIEIILIKNIYLNKYKKKSSEIE